MKKLLLLSLTIFIFSCSSTQESRYVCNCEEQKQLQEFVKTSIKPSNNMSDEEMEDVIRQLRIDGMKIYCKQKPVWVGNNDKIDWTKEKQDSCKIIMNHW